jgi:hypothetical protein
MSPPSRITRHGTRILNLPTSRSVSGGVAGGIRGSIYRGLPTVDNLLEDCRRKDAFACEWRSTSIHGQLIAGIPGHKEIGSLARYVHTCFQIVY